MATNNPSCTTLLHDFQERLASLLEDGYRLQFQTQSIELWYASLKHKSNGNRIFLKARLRDKELVQHTNYVRTHYKKY